MDTGHGVDAGLFWPGFVTGMILGACLSHLGNEERPQPQSRPVTSEDVSNAIEDMERPATTTH